MNIVELLDKSKTKLNVTSDYALAKALEINSGDVAGYRNGARRPTPYALVKIALLLDLDPLALIAAAEAQAEKNPTRKGFWENFLRRVNSAVAVLVVCYIALCGSGHANSGAGFFRRGKYA